MESESPRLFPAALPAIPTPAKTTPMRITSLLILLTTVAALAGTSDEDWKALTALDAGPGIEPKTADEGRKVALGHIEKQETALRAFLAEHPDSKRTFEAKIRLIRLLNLRSEMTGTKQPSEINTLLESVKSSASGPEQQTEVDYAFLSQRMRGAKGERPSEAERTELLDAVRVFQKAHPKDHRVPALLVEVSTLFEGDPATKQSLIVGAKKLTQDTALLAQIADDQKRLSNFGKPLALRFSSVRGNAHDVSEWRGKPVAILFFATWSKPSMDVFSEIEAAAKKNGAAFVAISLDYDRAAIVKFIQESKTKAFLAWDGKVWDSPIVQKLGINALPTAWVLDTDGILRHMDLTEAPNRILRDYSR